MTSGGKFLFGLGGIIAMLYLGRNAALKPTSATAAQSILKMPIAGSVMYQGKAWPVLKGMVSGTYAVAVTDGEGNVAYTMSGGVFTAANPASAMKTDQLKSRLNLLKGALTQYLKG